MRIEYDWEDCTLGFDCPECGEHLVCDTQDGEEVCDCGLKYQLCSYLLINGIKPADIEYEQKAIK